MLIFIHVYFLISNLNSYGDWRQLRNYVRELGYRKWSTKGCITFKQQGICGWTKAWLNETCSGLLLYKPP